jgi:hypothetical protein
MFPFAQNESLSDDDISALRVLYGWKPQYALQGGTEASPALCAAGNLLMMAWRGSQNDDAIWITRTADGKNWSPQGQVPGAASQEGPSLAWDGTLLWMAWRGIPRDDSIYYATTTDYFSAAISGGTNWSGVKSIPGAGSSHGPRIAICGGYPLLIWKGIDGDSRIYWSVFKNNQWQPQRVVENVGTSEGPAISPDLQFVARALWKGITGDSALYTSVAAGDPSSGLYWQPQQRFSWRMLGDADDPGSVAEPGTDGSPAMTSSASPAKILACWRGIPGDDGLYFSQLALDSFGAQFLPEWSQQANIPNVGSSHGPSIATFKGNIYVCWKGVPGDTTIWMTVF